MGYILIKIPAGLMAGRFGIKRVLIAGMVGYALAPGDTPQLPCSRLSPSMTVTTYSCLCVK
ncbi:hypothetical protein DRO49_04385 [Candidatus Bathyarchaeota archaeon]|nr:MAG: hypothetical protein DRO49_04385 [Candidatus Bathyarchaeota archaeon]